MPPISPEAFARSLRGLSDDELAAFVADLWAARGWETRVVGRIVVANQDGTTRRLLIAPRNRLSGWLPTRLGRRSDPVPDASSPDSGNFDAVVVRTLLPRATAGFGVIDAADLRGMTLYAVDPETRDRLFGRHLGRPPTTPPGDGVSLPSVPGAVVAAVVLLVAAAALGAVALGPQLSQAPSGATPPATPALTPGAADRDAASAGVETGQPDLALGDDAQFPPGIGADGIRDVNTIVVSHILGLAPHSHTWEIEYREVVDGRTRGSVRETVWIENASLYRSRVERVGTVENSPAVISGGSTYAHESASFERIHVRYERFDVGETTQYRRDFLWPWGNPGADDLPPFTDDPTHVIEWYLSVADSRVVDTYERNGTRFYRIEGEGDSSPGTTDVRVSATFDEDGVVRQLRRVHQPPDTEAHIVVTFRVSAIGNTTVEPPPWVDAARRATANETGAVSDR